MSDNDKTDFWSDPNALQRAWENAIGIKPLDLGTPFPLIGPSMPDHLAHKFEHLSRETGIPFIMAANLIGSERGYKADAISPTKAAGLAQMQSDALYERLYLDKKYFPPEIQNLIEEGIEKYDSNDDPHNPYWSYRAREIEIVDDDATYNLAPQLKALAMDEDIALTVGYNHTLFSIKEGTRVYAEILEGKIEHLKTLRQDALNTLGQTLESANHVKSDEQITAHNETILDKMRALNPSAQTAEQAEAHNADIRALHTEMLSYMPPEEDFEKHRAEIEKTAQKIGAYEDRILMLDKLLNRDFTAADLKIFYVCGATGGAELLEALTDPSKSHQRAADYAPARVVAANPHLFYKNAVNNTVPENPVYVSVEDFYEDVKNKVGVSPIPDELTWQPKTPEWHPPMELPKP
jgi:hypothetical protein